MDQRLREAERRWRETGLVEDEARWLLERLRAGELHETGLGVAAWCGHAAAARALAERGRVVDPPTDARAWLDGVPAPRRALYEVASLDWGPFCPPMPPWDFLRSRSLVLVAAALMRHATGRSLGDATRALSTETSSVSGALLALHHWVTPHRTHGRGVADLAAHVRARLLELALRGSASDLA